MRSRPLLCLNERERETGYCPMLYLAQLVSECEISGFFGLPEKHEEARRGKQSETINRGRNRAVAIGVQCSRRCDGCIA